MKTFPIEGIGIGVELDCGCRAISINDYEHFHSCAAHQPKSFDALDLQQHLEWRNELLRRAAAAQGKMGGLGRSRLAAAPTVPTALISLSRH